MKAPLTSLLTFSAAALSPPSTLALDEEKMRPALRRGAKATNQRRIESHEVEPGLFSVSVISDADHADTMHRRRAQVVRKLEEIKSCKLFMEDLHFDPSNALDSIDKWVCILENYTSESSGTPYPYALELSGDTIEELEQLDKTFKEAGVESARSYLRWNSPDMIRIDDAANTITLNPNATVSDVEGSDVWIDVEGATEADDRRKLKTTGPLRTLIIRIVGGNVQPEPSLSDLQNEIYGGGLSLKTQMARCSHGQVTIEPFRGYADGYFQQEITSGIIELRITTDPRGQSDKRMENDANEAAAYVLGNLNIQFDLVMFSIPPGTSPPFAAYAYIGTPFSYYSNNSIKDLMVQMHEVGHNLGLQHAGEGEDGSIDAEYGDKSGYMGYADADDPAMCYNAANNYQLGWYSEHTVTPTIGDDFGGTFVISGVAGYDAFDPSKFVTIRLEQPNLPGDYYLGYNWASGMNTGTQEDGDKVIIIEKNGDVDAVELTWKKAALGVGESYVIQNYDNSGKSLTVRFTEAQLSDAIVDIIPERFPSSAPSLAPSGSPSAAPSAAPSTLPSDSPSVAQSATPSEDPSAAPSTAPSVAPSAAPSEAPSEAPTLRDTLNPIYAQLAAYGAVRTSVVDDCDEGYKMEINVKTDLNPWENKWKFKNQNQARWTDRRNFQFPGTKYIDSYCLEYDNCYTFVFFDQGKDGMSVPDYPEADGYYAVFLDDELEFGRRGSGEWNRREVIRFCTQPQLSNDTGLIFDDDIDLLFTNETDWLFGNDTDLMFGNETEWICDNETDWLFGNETDIFNGEDSNWRDWLCGEEMDWLFDNETYVGNETLHL